MRFNILINKFYSKINALLKMLKSLKEMKSIFFENMIFLKNGKYTYNIFGKYCVYKKNIASELFVEKISKNRISKRGYIQSLLLFTINHFSNLVVTNEEDKLFDGDLLMKTIDGDIKIFNFDNLIVMTKVTDKSKMVTLKRNTDYFQNYYSLTTVNYDMNNSLIIDNLIDYKPYNNWLDSDKIKVIKRIFLGLKIQANSIDPKDIEHKSTFEFLNITKKLSHCDSIYELISMELDYFFKESCWPIIKCHGDLNFNNTLLSDTDVFIIDWDNSTNAVFFYDIMNLLFVDALYLDDCSFLDLYFDGKFDVWMKELFSLYNMSFISEYKSSYVLIYVLNRLIYYETVSNSQKYQLVIPKYEKVLGYIKKKY